ncbi:hypothetical protein Mycch_0154 [Mycolicibacterium chubuense NBB4]|uniref:Uncharacterized protein n=1 Tax=Mycolicibacterium chubuense (strain NBB4) TaxID=710421 RepID=I4BCH3_MYCCN|nr:hypothetical protein [Mycolicibacterium chubuense]AFM14980.1 hypothetical protein Mycch_0154 [Mycolicibacterium chubuense NBB4]
MPGPQPNSLTEETVTGRRDSQDTTIKLVDVAEFLVVEFEKGRLPTAGPLCRSGDAGMPCPHA